MENLLLSIENLETLAQNVKSEIDEKQSRKEFDSHSHSNMNLISDSNVFDPPGNSNGIVVQHNSPINNYGDCDYPIIKEDNSHFRPGITHD